MQYFILSLNGSKYYLKYTFKAIHDLAVLDVSIPLFSYLGMINMRDRGNELKNIDRYHDEDIILYILKWVLICVVFNVVY